MSCYFDDFVIFAPPGLANNSQSALSLMLDVFGWAFDREGPKIDNFSARVSALGVAFNLDPTADGRLEVHNIERRLKEGVDALDLIISAGRLVHCVADWHFVMLLFLADWVVFLSRTSRIMPMLHLLQLSYLLRQRIH